MTIALNTILGIIKSHVVSAASIPASRVHLGPIPLTQVGKDPHIVIVQTSESGERIDDGKTRRTLGLHIGVMMRIDTVKGEVDLQVNAIYEPIHAALEMLRDGVASNPGVFLEVREASQGPESGVVADRVPVRYKSATWDIIYDRALGGTA